MSTNTHVQTTTHRTAERTPLDLLSDAVLILDAQGNTTRNAAMHELLAGEPTLNGDLDALLTTAEYHAASRRAMETGRVQVFEWILPGRAYRVTVGATDAQTVLQFRDVTNENATRNRLAQLHDLTSRLSGAMEPEQLVDVILNVALPILGAARGAVFTFNRRHDKAHMVGSVGFPPEMQDMYSTVPVHGNEHLQRVGRGERIITTAHALRAHLNLPLPPEYADTQLVILPLVCDGNVGGALSLAFGATRHFGEDDLAFMHDVSAKCAQAFRRSGLLLETQYERERLQKLIEATAQVVWWTNASGEVTSPSRTWAEFTGREPSHMLGSGWLEAVHPDDREGTLRAWRAALKDRTSYDHTYRLRRHDGEYRVVRARGEPMYFDGRLREWMGVGLDITEQVLAEQHLHSWNHELKRQVGDRTEELRRALEHLQAESDALKAFAQFTETAGREEDLDTLVERALDVIVSTVPGSAAAYSVRQADLWHLRAHAGNLDERIIAAYREGGPLIAPHLASDLLSGNVAFLNDVPPQPDIETFDLSAVGMVPVRRGGATFGMIGVVLAEGPWCERDQAIVTAVGQALNLTVERAGRALELQEAHQALQTDTDALKAFAAFMQVAEHAHSVDEVIRGALDVLCEALPDSGTNLIVRDGGDWKLHLHAGNVPEHTARAYQNAIPQDFHRLLDAVAGGSSFFFDTWPPEGVTAPSAYQAVAVMPVAGLYGNVGVFAVGKPSGAWSERERAVMRTVTGALSVAVQRVMRAEQVEAAHEALRSETDALKAFAAFTELAGQAQDLDTLAQHASELLMRSLNHAVSAAQYAHASGTWRLVRHDGYMHPEVVEEFRAGFTLRFPEWDTQLQAGESLFFDEWPPQGLNVRAAASIAAFTPIKVGGQVQGMISVGLRVPGGGVWTARDRAIVTAVGRALSLAAERAERERRLQEKREQLEALNAELDAFAQMVSHDLRAPVRHVRGFASLAGRAVEQGSPDQALKHLRTIEWSAERADVMIDALLNLAREAQTTLRWQDVNLGELVRDASALLEAETAGRNIEWHMNDLSNVRGDRNLLRQVMLNLLSNAVKYSRDRDPAVIRIDCEKLGGWVTIRVTDNGAGFDQKYAGKLFHPFRRLHRDAEFTGTGVGLASVARIVRRHGGTVEARGEAGRGATFTVRLPA